MGLGYSKRYVSTLFDQTSIAVAAAVSGCRAIPDSLTDA